MHGWSEWRRFPDPRQHGILTAPLGPGIYELRRENVLVYCGSSGNVASRMSSLLPSPLGCGTRNNRKLCDYVLENVGHLEYRTLPCDTSDEAKVHEGQLKQIGKYLFHT